MAVKEIMLSVVIILRGRWTKMCGQYQMIMLCIGVPICKRLQNLKPAITII